MTVPIPPNAQPPYCAWCAARIAPEANFCATCGRPRAASTAPRGGPALGGVPLWALGGAVVVLVGGAVAVAARGEARPPAAAAPPVGPFQGGGAAEGAPPDISQMTPRERFDRLFDRVMRAAEGGDIATVERFGPMATAAFGMLDTVDVDARYHMAMLAMHTGDLAFARAQTDSIVREAPDHLFGYMLRASLARQAGDQAGARTARAAFAARYDREMQAARPEYQAHAEGIRRFREEGQD